MLRLKECREACGLSQKAVAATLKVAAPSVSNWESGKTSPTHDNLEKLADLYNVSVDYLLGREPQTEKPAISDGLTDDERRLLRLYRTLNAEGQEIAMDHMVFLADSGKYIKSDAAVMAAKEVSV